MATISTNTETGTALLQAPKDAAPPRSQVMIEVARRFGVSPIRQMREIWTLRRSATKIAPHEYYASGLFHPDLPMEDKRRFVGRTGSYLVNSRLSPMPLTEMRPFLRDKVAYTALLSRLGLATTQTLALAHPTRRLGDLPVLRTAADLAAFLVSDAAHYPIFGKPAQGEASIGSVRIDAVDATDRILHLGNGKKIPLDRFAEEAMRDYPEGFILQKSLHQHADLTAAIGTSVGTLRVVTICVEDGPRPLYTVWKIPAPTAMSDNFWQDGSMVAALSDDGRVTQVRRGTGLNGEWLRRHPMTRAEFADVRIPNWDALQKLAADAHAIFPEFGIVGWDIAMTSEGPVIIEANDNPFHVLWQLAHGKGFHTPEHAEICDRVAAHVQGLHEAKVATFRARKAARRA